MSQAASPGSESAIAFACAGERLLGIVTRPQQAATTGVVIVVGGPQYRVGSHRQFVLLARDLAEAGYAVLRFDCRGMGDSDGEARSFEDVDLDVAAAIDALAAACPEVGSVVLWGLCDGASAALLYSLRRPDARVRGLVLLNPWVRSEQSLARVRLRHYYGERLLQPEFWKKLVRGGTNLVAAVRDLARNWRLAPGAHRTRCPIRCGAIVSQLDGSRFSGLRWPHPDNPQWPRRHCAGVSRLRELRSAVGWFIAARPACAARCAGCRPYVFGSGCALCGGTGHPRMVGAPAGADR